MSLSLLEEQLNDINLQLHRPWQWDLIGRRSTRCRLSNPQASPFPYRYDLRDGGVAIQNSDGFPALYGAEKLAQFGFQFGNAYLFHDYIWP
jgi:hypothetical protein